jgi:tyrosyl-tRNA synthetase
MKKNFVEELRWRGMLHDIMPGTEEQLTKESTTGYIGFDPTADSLHIGSLAQIMVLVHFQKCGHTPIALIGGATGMIGDPSGKKEERKLLSVEDIEHNADCIKSQLSKFLDFNSKENPARLVNNNDWFQGLQMISFLRDAGKYLTVNYLLSKGFVKERLSQEGELSFTEFNYILMQAYDFMYLFEHQNCKLQMGGSDQWGNITAGNDLIRKKLRGDAFALTCKLITKADGTKFGKTEKGNVWLDPKKTSVYNFYQFWIKSSDIDAANYIKVFTQRSKEEIDALIAEHNQAPHLYKLQKELAKDITIRVHSIEAYETAVKASSILFGNSVTEDLLSLDEETLLSVLDGVPQTTISRSDLISCATATDLLSEGTKRVIFPSKGEARKMIQAGGVSINKIKLNDPNQLPNFNLLHGKFLLAQKGKTNYFLIEVTD